MIVLALLALPLLTASAQSAPSSGAGVDPALASRAAAGDAAAQVRLGESYAAGCGAARTPRQLSEDYKQAATWFRKAAEQGSVAGEIHLAELYRDGNGVVRDAAQAATWYRKAAEQGDPGAQGTLGILYSLGQGMPRSDVEAYFWLDLAAAVKGPRQSQYAANRQMIGTHITAEELASVEDRVEAWLAAHPR